MVEEGRALERFPGGVIVYDGRGVAIEANPVACSMLGTTPSAFIGSRAEESDWLIVEGGEGGAGVHPVTSALRSRAPVSGVLARARRPDGTDVWLQVDATPDAWQAGEVTRVIASLTDVTRLLTHSRFSGRSVGDHILAEVTEQLVSTRLDPQAILEAITSTLSRLRPGTWVASLVNKDPTTMRLVAADDDDSQIAAYIEAAQRSSHAPATPLLAGVLDSGEPLLIPTIQVEKLVGSLTEDVRDYLAKYPWPVANIRTMGVAVVPMRVRGTRIGTIGLFERRGSNPLTEKDLIWMQAVADRAAVAVENAQLYEDAVQRLERLSSLQGVGRAISAGPDLPVTLNVILDQVTKQLKVDAADVLLVDESDGMLALAASTGFVATSMVDYRVPAEEGSPVRAVMARRVETVTALGGFSQFRRRSLFAREGFKSYGAVPLIARSKLLGVLEVFHRSLLKPDQEWIQFLDTLGSEAAIAIDNSAMHERLREAGAVGPRPRAASQAPELSRLERQILGLVVEGLSNREISERVHLSPNTIKFHVHQILQKSGVSNRTELASVATRHGWL
ncbi:MAG TPA: GAF domain-containing protein [Candidatus Dormibacteraeota bacterium]|nr:GAF domain-containing protein [Candidatus Dormibacteraeota bacterium]